MVPKKKSAGEPPASLAPFGMATAAVAALGGASNRKSSKGWYRRLRKPPFQPPAAVFAPVWTGLYAAMAWSAWRVASKAASPARTRALALWWTQLALNGAWSPLFFGLRKPRAAMVDITMLLGAIAAYAAAAREVDRAAARAMAPYLAWVAFATLLNAEIVRRNKRWG